MRQKIIEFMRWKQSCLEEKIGSFMYFTGKDEESINNLTDAQIKKIVDGLKEAIHEEDDDLWDSDICPFCIIADRDKYDLLVCDGCQYAKEHGECQTLESDWGSIIGKLGNTHIVDYIGQNKVKNKLMSLFGG